MPSSITQIQKELKGKGLVVLAVSIAENRDTVAAWTTRVGLPFPIFLDPEGAAARAWRVRSTPTVFLVDRQGRVVGTAVGNKSWASPAARALFAALLGP